MYVTINLLPPEMRPKERPSLAQVLPVAAAALIVVLAGGAFAYLHFEVRGKALTQRDQLASSEASLRPKVDYATKLKGEESDYRGRVDTIAQIAASRVLWSKHLTQLIDVIEADEDGQRFLVWIESFEVKPGRGNADPKAKNQVPTNEVALDLVCFSNDQPLFAFNQFHSDLKNSALFAGAGGSISPPAGSARFFDGELKPQNGWASKVGLTLNAPEPVKRRPARAN